MALHRIALDVMGGDLAPDATLLGARQALRQWDDIHLYLVGPESLVREGCTKHGFTPNDLNRITFSHAASVVNFDDASTVVLKEKKDSSIRIAAQLVREGTCDGMLTMGHTGAAMVASTLVIGKLQGVDRPGLASPMPNQSMTHPTVLMEVGASIDSRPEHLVTFALMGKIYAEKVLNISNPRIGILSIGEEESKGTEFVLKTADLLRQSSMNFLGNAEGRDIWNGKFDVIVCDGFVGNALIKSAEGTAKLFKSGITQSLMSTWYTKLGALLIKGALKKFLKMLDYKEYGGLPLLGIKGVSVIGHGSSDARAIYNAIRVTRTSIERKLPELITEGLQELQGLDS